jgi:SAM-dependent methyltransferase
MTRWEQIARSTAGDDYAKKYAERFRTMAESGQDIHGEAAFVTGLVEPPACVLDAGCGTGRIAIRLSELGYDVVGVDLDPTMLAEAQAAAPTLDWRLADLAQLDLGETFDLVLLAGNTIPLLEPDSLEGTCLRLAAHLEPTGRLVCGFGLDDAHLPAGCPVTPLPEVNRAMTSAGLREVELWSTWDRDPFDVGASGYVVTVHEAAAGR